MDHWQMHPENVRAWLDALLDYRRAFGRLVSVDDDGAVCMCPLGVACEVARRAGVPMELELGAERAMFRTAAHTLPFFLASDWMGVELLAIRIRPERLPGWLRGRIELAVELWRARSPERFAVDAELGIGRDGFEIMVLSDRGVELADLQAALRWTLDVDRHLVVDPDGRSASELTAEVSSS